MDWQATLLEWWDQEWVRAGAYSGALALVAIIAWMGDRRRMTRSNPDAVGWLPWRDIAFWSAFGAFLMAVFGRFFV